MAEKIFSWDEIPSLEDAGVDWDYKPDISSDKRKYVRLNTDGLFKLYELKEILVRLATTKQTYDGKLVDISQGGLSLILPILLEINLPVKIALLLGTEKIVSHGIVRHTNQDNNQCVAGIQFVDLAPASREYIASLYASKTLSHPSL